MWWYSGQPLEVAILFLSYIVSVVPADGWGRDSLTISSRKAYMAYMEWVVIVNICHALGVT